MPDPDEQNSGNKNPPRATITPSVAGRSVEELARHEDPAEKLRREFENFRVLQETERRLEAQDERRALLSRLAVINRKLGLPSKCTCDGHPLTKE